MKAAIIGLGIIGSEWAKHLAADNILAASWNRSSKDNAPFFSNDLSSLPEKAEILHIVVADPPAISSILDTIVPKLSAKHLIIQSSTIDPQSAESFAARVRAKGASYLETPFTGSLPAAQKRELIFYAGGSKETFEKAQGYLQKLSKKIFYIGSERQACTLKLSMNLQIASALQALVEALSTCRNAEISDEIFFQAFSLNASYSGVAALKEPKLKKRDFSPQFSVKHMRKDLRLLQNSLPASSLPVLDTLVHRFEMAQNAGFGDLDFCSLIKLLDN